MCVQNSALKYSFIIPSYNEENHIGKCIESIMTLTSTEKYEIILVDNGSTDKTVAIATRYPIKVLEKRDCNVGAVRNYGERHAMGEMICFIDADCAVSSDWLDHVNNYLGNFTKGEIGILGADYQLPQQSNVIQKAWFSHIKPDYVGPTEFVPAGNMVIPKNLFESMGGFQEDIPSGEDYELCNRILSKDLKVFYDYRLKCFHYGYPRTLKEFIRREVWHGKGMIVDFKNPLKSLPLLISLIYLISYGIFAVIVSLWFVGVHYFFVLPYVLSFMLLPLAAYAFIKAFRNRRFKYFPVLFLLYLLYSFSRSFSLLGLAFNFIQRKNR